MEAIKSEKEYEDALEEVNTLMKKGDDLISDEEADRVEELALAIQAYEDVHYPFPMPKSIPELVESKRFELNLSIAGLAELLGLGKTKLSKILRGQRDPDIPFLKAVYHKLGIDPGVLLDNA
ncbi:helix-turn-helix domain-containing protein [Dyadobacter fermentans]|uniref:Transcriptional regulator, XRE family n=1 Tax=Dyadobacter fermentans (strain ATCC 700827 / DSM 18053 / CIP 107007 / KCTC 52180 / NS114) TaxID=471854 RepID=C6VXL2_DYAFD|nr:helix-turn-helix domain-containing protein [Dyadobacter fermentans]ACT93355.1 transcriptional regulator, XRE family [Dyadobacter fermentans DSM 18053]